MSDSRLPPGKNFCKCTACGEYFYSPTAFDMHRTGPARDRACLTAHEMRESGFRKNPKGYWMVLSRVTEEVAA